MTIFGDVPTDKPMMPFLAGDLHGLLSGLRKCFLKVDILKVSDSMKKIMKLDPEHKKIHSNYAKVDLGFSAEQELKMLKSHTSTVTFSDRQVMQVRIECGDFLMKTVVKLMEKSPLESPLTRSMSSLDHKQLA